MATKPETSLARVNKIPFITVLYNFRVAPNPQYNKSFTLQQPFSILFDNLITVLWSVYGKKSNTQIGINQLRWALEFMKCMKSDYGYPQSIQRIVGELEDQLIELYAMIGIKLRENDEKMNQEKADFLASESGEPMESVHSIFTMNEFKSFNEVDIMDKLKDMKIPLDSITGEINCLKELNSLGQKKIITDPCYGDKKSTKFYMITALQKLLKKTTDATARTGVEQLIKDLRFDKIQVKYTP